MVHDPITRIYFIRTYRPLPIQTLSTNPIHEIHTQIASASKSWADVDILDTFNEIYQIDINATSYVITWNSPDVSVNDSKIQQTTFQRANGSYSDTFHGWAYRRDPTMSNVDQYHTERIIPKTFIILYGDSNERMALRDWMDRDARSGHTNCRRSISHGYCCDAEDAGHGINVTFCNVFAYGVQAGSGSCPETIHAWIAQSHWRRLRSQSDTFESNTSARRLPTVTVREEASPRVRIQSSLAKWQAMYGVNVTDECQSGRWQCHAMFQSLQWDVYCQPADVADRLKWMEGYKPNLWRLYQSLNTDLLSFVNHKLIWRTSPFAMKWAKTDHEGSDTRISTISGYNQVGLNLFESEAQSHNIRMFHWANFMPVASKVGDDHHWNPKYNELYLGLLYRYTTLPQQPSKQVISE